MYASAFEVERASLDFKVGLMRVLAIDASLRNTGVAIVDANNGKPQSVYFGTIHNKSAMRPSSCLVCIRDRLAELIREHAPDCCALESVIYVQSYKTAIILGAARGAAILAAAENGLPVFEYSPRRIKQSDGGSRRRRQRSGRVHGARAAWSNRNAGCRRRRRAGDRAYSFAHAGNSGARSSGRNANMNGEIGRDAALSDRTSKVRWLGRMEFARALELQEELVAKKREDASLEDQLLLLEHEPVYTIGRTPDRSSLSATGSRPSRDGELGSAHLPHPLFSINRGGQATYHGPGQLMGYPIIDLRRCGQDLHKYLRWLEQLLIDLLARYDIAAQRRESLTGVWVENRKIASIGVGVRHWITMHGFALNVCGDLSPFDHIVPCGINNVAITSMEKETKKSFTVAEVATAFEKIASRRISDLRVAEALSAVGA